MPGAAHQNGFDAERFAAVWAGADTGNNNEAEAVNKFREARRMAAANGWRIVDCMTGRDDVMAALDAQLQPVRKESPEVKKLRRDNAQLEKDGAALAQEVNRQAELIGELRQARNPVPACAGMFQAGAAAPAGAYLGGLCAFLSVMGGAAMLFMAGRHVMAWLFG